MTYQSRNWKTAESVFKPGSAATLVPTEGHAGPRTPAVYLGVGHGAKCLREGDKLQLMVFAFFSAKFHFTSLRVQ